MDLHQVPRTEIHLNIVNMLKDKLTSKIPTLDTPQLLTLLESSYRYIKIEEVRSIPMAALEQLCRKNHVPDIVSYLKALSVDVHLYNQCSIDVKRQIWMADVPTFQHHLMPLISAIVWPNDLVIAAFDIVIDPQAATWNPTKRRQESKELQEMVQCIGGSSFLYGQVHFLNLLFHYFYIIIEDILWNFE